MSDTVRRIASEQVLVQTAEVLQTVAGREPAAAVREQRARRICIVSDSPLFAPPFTMGGIERQLSGLARELELRGFEVRIVARAISECASAPMPATTGGLRTHYVPPAAVPKGSGWKALGPNLRFIAGTFRYLHRMRDDYDVLIVSGMRQLGLPIAVLARIVGKPCVVRIESVWDLEDELTAESNARIGPVAQRLVSTVIRLSRRLLFRLAHVLIAFSDPLERRLVELGSAPGKIWKIPNGVDTSRFVPVPPEEKETLRRRLGLPRDRTIFIYTGRICRAKGIVELMRVWERLADRNDVHLLLLGSGELSYESCESELREMIRRRPDSIGWRGPVENVVEYLQAADVFVFLSHFETFSLSISEAVAAGLPCLVTDVGCAREIVRHHENGAILPSPAPIETILSEIDWLLARRERWPAMGALARASVVNQFDMSLIARRYLAMLEVLGARARTPRGA